MEWIFSSHSEYEAKQPQLEPKPVGSDPQALFNPRPQPASKTSLILLDNNPFDIYYLCWHNLCKCLFRRSSKNSW